MVVRVNGSTGIVTVSGTSGAPSLRGPDGNSGISFDGDQVIISSSGLVAATFSDSAATINNLSVDTTTFEFSPGSSGTPTVAPSGDLNTGIYFPAADTIGFAEGGNEAGRFDSSGRFLVGTTAARTGLGPDINPLQQVESTSYTTSALSVINNQNTANPSFLILGKSRGTSVGGSGILSTNDSVGEIRFVGADGVDLQNRPGAIFCAVDATPGADTIPGRLSFSTTASSASDPSERVRIRNNGNLRINMANFGANVSGSNTGVEFSPGVNPVLRIGNSDTTSNNVVEFYNPNGQVGRIATSGSSTSYNTSSDYRLKENVVDLDGAIDRLKQLAPKRFNFIADAETTVDGFIAHEAQTVVPEAISGLKDEIAVWKENDELPDGVSVGDNKLDEDGNTIPVYQGIDQSKLVPLLTAALQEAIGKIEALETTNVSQAATIAALDARLASLESA